MRVLMKTYYQIYRFGRAKYENDGRIYNVDIKSVNHKYSDISIKMPRSFSYLEEKLKKEIISTISRGKIDVFITFENYSDQGKEIVINNDLFKKYLDFTDGIEIWIAKQNNGLYVVSYNEPTIEEFIVTVPSDIPVTFPELLTIAILLSLLDHVTPLKFISSTNQPVLSGLSGRCISFPCAVNAYNCNVLPTSTTFISVSKFNLSPTE